MPEEQEKREVEQEAEEKKKEVAWWRRLHPLVLGGSILIAFLIINKMMTDVENRNTYIFWLVAIGVILYLISQVPKTKEEEMITPKEAELLTERECERKRRWGQFGPMTKYEIGPIGPLQRRDGGGLYYDIAVEVTSPYDRPEYFVATVMAKGQERGFTWLIKSIGPIHGREKVPEKDYIPGWFKRTEQSGLLERIMFNK